MNKMKGSIYDIFEDNVKSGSNWCFIFGTPKSGKTLLRNILNTHGDISLITEAWLWGYVDILCKKNVVLNYPKDNYELTGGDCHSDIRNDEFLIQCLENRGIKNSYDDGWPASAIRKIMDGYRNAIAPNSLIFGEERRVYAYCIHDLINVFPDCKLIYTKRNLWDTVGGMMGVNWGGEKWQNKDENHLPRVEYAKKVLHCAQRSVDSIEQKIKNYNVYKLCFEDMASNFDKTMLGLCKHLNVDFDDFNSLKLNNLSNFYQLGIHQWKEFPELFKLRGE